jgi:hypothetical protein
MRRFVVAVFAVASAWGLGIVTAQQPGAPQGQPSCEPVGPIRFVCGQAGPEDLVAVPDSRWIIASGYAPAGGIHLVDTRAGTSARIFPSDAAAERFDKATYDTCPGPVQGPDRQQFRTHGLYIKEGRDRTHTLYAVHHGARESVEVFELNVRAARPTVTWIGCVVAPDPIGLNAVVALPEGGFIASNFDPRPPAGARGGGFSEALLAGRNNGELWEWHTRTGWAKVPGSEAAGANGLEISKDARWLYVAQWGNRSFMRLSRGAATPTRDVIDLGFRVDNVRWAPDGTLWVAGQGGPDSAIFRGRGPSQGVATATIGKVDPKTMRYRTVIDYPLSPQVAFSTVAVQVGNELWVGTSFADRIAIYPAAGIPRAARDAERPARAPSAALKPPAFHHLHMNAVDPAATIATYRTLWPTTTQATTVGGFQALSNGTVHLLFNRVSKPAPLLPQSAYWHQVWLTPDVRAYVARAKRNGMVAEPLYTSDEGNSVEISSETLPGSLTRTALEEAKKKGVVPTRQAGYTYIAGPDGLSVEGFERANDTERLAQIDMWQDHPICAELWYEKHLGGTRRAPAAGTAAPTESTCVVAPGEPTWPSTMRQGTRRTPSGRVAYGDVALFWYTRPGDTPLASTRGQAVDHLAFAVDDLDAWVDKLKRERVKILRQPYAFGAGRAVLIEGPSREAIEILEVR